MFTNPRPNLVVSDEGFSVEVMGRTGVQYKDASCTVTVDGEVLAGPSGFMIYRDSMIRIDLPNDGEISEVMRSAIVENIRRAFAFRGFDIEIY